MKNKFLKFLKVIFPWIITITIFIFIFHKIPVNAVFNALKQVKLNYFFLSLFISTLAHLFLNIEKYRRILNFLGYPISPKEVRLLKLGSSPIKAILPFKSGELIRTISLKKEYRMPYPKGLHAIVLDYSLNLSALASFLLIGRSLYINSFPLLVLIPISLVGFLFVKKRTWYYNLLPIILYSISFEFCSLFNTYILFRALGINIPLANCFFLTPLTLIAAALPISIAGLGARETSIIFLFSKYALAEQLLTTGLLISAVNALWPVIIGLLFIKPFLLRLLEKNDFGCKKIS